MPQQQTVSCAEGVFTELTDADVTAITFQVIEGRGVAVVIKNGSADPADLDGALMYVKGQGEAAAALADLAPGTTSPNRVFAFSVTGTATVAVSHA